jgi:hypothetical protein
MASKQELKRYEYVYNLHEVKGLSYNQIARKLGVTKARAQELLKKHLRGDVPTLKPQAALSGARARERNAVDLVSTLDKQHTMLLAAGDRSGLLSLADLYEDKGCVIMAGLIRREADGL